jgi:hypothetical protein
VMLAHARARTPTVALSKYIEPQVQCARVRVHACIGAR